MDHQLIVLLVKLLEVFLLLCKIFNLLVKCIHLGLYSLKSLVGCCSVCAGIVQGCLCVCKLFICLCLLLYCLVVFLICLSNCFSGLVICFRCSSKSFLSFLKSCLSIILCLISFCPGIAGVGNVCIIYSGISIFRSIIIRIVEIGLLCLCFSKLFISSIGCVLSCKVAYQCFSDSCGCLCKITFLIADKCDVSSNFHKSILNVGYNRLILGTNNFISRVDSLNRYYSIIYCLCSCGNIVINHFHTFACCLCSCR